MRSLQKLHKREWSNLSPDRQRGWLEKANHLISRGYPVEKDVYKLAEILYNKSH